ncbi:MAG: histidinol dehydrogenase [Gammaproteobacteria bacterium]
MKRLDTQHPDFAERFAALLAEEAGAGPQVTDTVRGIIEDVRRRGDQALLEYTARFDRHAPGSAAELELSAASVAAALTACDPPLRAALEEAARRIRRYHEHQVQRSWTYEDEDGIVLGQQVTALERVGVYVPGGKAAYPSSVLMNVIPAKVAGVDQVLMVVPAPDGRLNPAVLAAAAVAGVDRVFTVGGAQAVAALAYGTELVPRVDKIVGPGNIYVATAKALVFGVVGIDMIAGPSEVVVVSDDGSNPDWVAMDLFAQAEHDEQARAVLLSPDGAFLDRVTASIARLIGGMERSAIIRAALEGRGAMIKVRDLDEAATLVNRIAPEHLELSVAEPVALAAKVRHAGAIFLGRYSAEVLGDYCAGPNHVLPTAGTARFSSPLGVYDFQKRSSLIHCSARGAHRLAGTAALLARAEGLTAHAHSAELRMLPPA